MSKKAFAIVLLSVFLLSVSGCASFFTIGEEKFACTGNPEGGQCGDPKTIYKNKEKILREYGNKNENKESKKESKDLKNGKQNSKTGQADIPMPVRRTEEIARVFINGFKDHRGNLLGNIWAFIVANDGDWLSPDGRRIVNVK